MVQGAKVVLADEPIASLDPESSRKVMDILARVNREDGCTAVVSLHQVNVAMKYCRTVALQQGRVVYDGPSVGLTPAVLRDLYGVEADDILSLGDHISSLEDVLKVIDQGADDTTHAVNIRRCNCSALVVKNAFMRYRLTPPCAASILRIILLQFSAGSMPAHCAVPTTAFLMK